MIIVVKVGGDLLSEGFAQGLIDEIEVLCKEHSVILVHGGGGIVTEISTRLGHPPKFVASPRGFRSRYTDKETSEIYTMVMVGKINKEIVSSLQRCGIAAVGLSGLDGGLIKAKRKEQLIILDERGRRVLIDGGYTGQVTEVSKGFIRLLIENQYLPVISPVAMGKGGQPLNVDGDRIAANVASTIEADRLILLTDVEGVFLDGKPVYELHLSEAKKVVNKVGVGMITKVHAAIEAVEGGVAEAVITSGLQESAILSAIDHRSGTVIRK